MILFLLCFILIKISTSAETIEYQRKKPFFFSFCDTETKIVENVREGFVDIEIIVDTKEMVRSGWILESCADIRFVQNGAPREYFFEGMCGTGNSSIWVKVFVGSTTDKMMESVSAYKNDGMFVDRIAEIMDLIAAGNSWYFGVVEMDFGVVGGNLSEHLLDTDYMRIKKLMNGNLMFGFNETVLEVEPAEFPVRDHVEPHLLLQPHRLADRAVLHFSQLLCRDLSLVVAKASFLEVGGAQQASHNIRSH